MLQVNNTNSTVLIQPEDCSLREASQSDRRSALNSERTVKYKCFSVKSLENVPLSFIKSLRPSYNLEGISHFQVTPPSSKKDIARLSVELVSACIPALSTMKSFIQLGSLLWATTSRAEATNTHPYISINGKGDLSKIGKDPKFPIDGRYQQEHDFSVKGLEPVGSPEKPFTGEYDGNCRLLEEPDHCIFGEISNHGSVSNLRIEKASIKEPGSNAGVVACKLSGQAKLQSIHVQDSVIHSSPTSQASAIGAGILSGSSAIHGLTADNCTVTATANKASIAVGAGIAENNAVVSSISAHSCTLSVSGENPKAAIAVGVAKNSVSILDTQADNCLIVSEGRQANAAIAVAQALGPVTVERTVSQNNTVQASCPADCAAGVAVGFSMQHGEPAAIINNTWSSHDFVLSSGNGADAGFGAGDISGNVYLENTRSLHSHAISNSTNGGAAAGTGHSVALIYEHPVINKTSALYSLVSALSGNVGIGVGISSHSTDNAGEIACNSTIGNSFSDCDLSAEDLAQTMQTDAFNANKPICRMEPTTPPILPPTSPPTTTATTSLATPISSEIPVITPSLGLGLGLCVPISAISIYGGYMLYKGYQEGLRGKSLAMYPINKSFEYGHRAISYLRPNTGVPLNNEYISTQDLVSIRSLNDTTETT